MNKNRKLTWSMVLMFYVFMMGVFSMQEHWWISLVEIIVGAGYVLFVCWVNMRCKEKDLNAGKDALEKIA